MSEAPTAAPGTQLDEPDPDQAWRALALVTDWVKHAENKLIAVLGAAGVCGGVLFNLVQDLRHSGILFVATAALCAVATTTAGICAMLGLTPRINVDHRPARPMNPLFFEDVANAYRADTPGYQHALEALVADRTALVRHLAQQIHASSTIAQRKYAWANRAVYTLYVTLISLAVLAAVHAT